MTKDFNNVVEECLDVFEKFDGSIAEVVGVDEANRLRMREVLKHFYMNWDDEELDCTPFAHPAWFRGQVAGVEGAVARVREAQAGKTAGRIYNDNLHELCKDIVHLELIAKSKKKDNS